MKKMEKFFDFLTDDEAKKIWNEKDVVIVTPDGTDMYAENMSFKEARLAFPGCDFAVEKQLYNFVVGVTLFVGNTEKAEEMVLITSNCPMTKDNIREEFSHANACMFALRDLADDFEGNIQEMEKYYPKEAKLILSLDEIPEELRGGYLIGENISTLMYGVLAFSKKIVRIQGTSETRVCSRWISEDIRIQKAEFPKYINGFFCICI